ncbi:MAG: RDD family protein [Dermatophilaceae bacterium]
MVDRRDVASWLEGPPGRAPQQGDFPGHRLGLPQDGPGSIGRFGRRLVAILVDWTLCQLLAFVMFRVEPGRGGATSFAPLAIFAAENLLLVGTLGFTVGHRLLGLRVLSLTGRRASAVQVLIRTSLLCLAIPALIWDRDGRGLHDKAAGTLIVRMGVRA